MIFMSTDRKIFLAPLSGITSHSFRIICKEYGADVLLSEMVSADGIIRGNKKSLNMLYFTEKERPFGVQIFGSESFIIAEAAKIVSKYNPDFIDINFGCPVRKIVQKGAGAALLKNPKKIKEIVETVLNNVNIPVTAKIRSGWDVNHIICIELSKIFEKIGVSAVTIHPRTKSMMFKDKSDWSLIKDIKRNVNIPVIGNGDIFNCFDAKKMFDETNCDHIMIGRGALGNPWIFKNIKNYLNNGIVPRKPSYEEIIDVCIKQLKLSLNEKGDFHGIIDMRKHISWYIKGLPNNSEIKRFIFKESRKEKIEQILIDYKRTLQNLDKKI